MSEVMLNVRDGRRAMHNTVHGSYVDYVVAALSADPETIEELQEALARFLPDEAERFFAGWSSGMREEPWDAGVCIIDLTARVVASESTYSRPVQRAGLEMTDKKGKAVVVPYHVADDWLFINDMLSWRRHSDKRRQQRLAEPALDGRAVLYGKVCEFIVQSCWSESRKQTTDDDEVHAEISAIHADWLTTPRGDLRGQAPRDVLLAGRGHINRDMDDRCQHWSLLGACPPHLPIDSAAHRLGAFGTHEIVLYYNMVRHLIHDCWDRPVFARPDASEMAEEIRRLETVRGDWLETPDDMDLGGRTPASVIAKERARIPEAMSGEEAMADHDCPLCRMMADSENPFFWHLDGCNMDDEFAFSFHRTREEFDEERREYEEFSRKFNEDWKAREAARAKSIWQRSFVDDEAVAAAGGAVTLFGMACHLAELTEDLRSAGAEQAAIDQLNREFGNLREVAQSESAALLDPVVDKLCESLQTWCDRHPSLEAKCDDLQRQLRTLAGRRDEADWDEDVPF